MARLLLGGDFVSCEMVWWRGEVTGYRPKDALGTGLNFRKFCLRVDIILALLSVSEVRISLR